MSSRLPPPPPVAVLRGHDDAVVSIKFLNKGQLFSGAANGKLRLWNLRTMRSVLSMQAHDASILSINVNPDTKTITQSRDGTIKVWDTEVLSNISQQPMPIRTLKTGFDHFCNASTCSTAECSVLASPGMEQSEIVLWDMRASQPAAMRFTPEAGAGMVTSLRLCESSVWSTSIGALSLGLLAGYEDGTLFGLDLRMGANPLFSHKLHSEPIFALDAHASPRGTQVVTGGGDSLLQRSTIVSGRATGGSAVAEVVPSEKVDLPHAGTGCVKYRSDGRIIVSAHWDGTVRVFDQKRLKPLAVLRHHRDSAYAVDFAPSADSAAGSCKALGTAPARISSETTEAPEEEQVPEHVPQQHQYIAHFQEMSGVDPETAELSAECSLPGGIFATGSKDHTIAIWDLFADSCAV